MSLIVKHRPRTLDEIVGQKAVIKSIKKTLERKSRPKSWLFIGPSGTGKTTCARILANIFADGKANQSNVIEVDMATNSGAEATRDLVQRANYRALGESPIKTIIGDECFHSETMVTTVNGKKKISSINIGEIVLTPRGFKKITQIFKSRICLDRLCLIRLTDSSELVCSDTHLIYANEKWTEACNLNVEDSLSLQSEAMQRMQNNIPAYSQRGLVLSRMQTPKIKLFKLWNRIQKRSTVKYANLLFKGMRKFISRAKTQWKEATRGGGSNKEGYFKVTDRKSRPLEANRQRIIKTYENKEPIPQSKSDCQGKGNQIFKRNTEYLAWKAWGQWANYPSTAKISGFARLGNGGSNSIAFRTWVSNLLQGGCWKQTAKDRNRSRWGWTQINKIKGKRLEKSKKIKGIRVESVSSYKQTNRQFLFKDYLSAEDHNRGWTYLYDLEVSDEHCYFAEGILVHNCHRASAAAWSSLLKPIEEPPSHVYWVLCTTETGKIPDTIKNRCVTFTLKQVDDLELFEYLEKINNLEKLNALPEVLEAIIDASKGSPRQALSYLESCAHAGTVGEAKELMKSSLHAKEAIDLARFIVGKNNKSWTDVTKLMGSIENIDAEGFRITISNYIATILIKAKSDNEARRLLFILECFSTPYSASDKLAPLLMSIGLALGLNAGG